MFQRHSSFLHENTDSSPLMIFLTQNLLTLTSAPGSQCSWPTDGGIDLWATNEDHECSGGEVCISGITSSQAARASPHALSTRAENPVCRALDLN